MMIHTIFSRTPALPNRDKLTDREKTYQCVGFVQVCVCGGGTEGTYPGL